MNKEIQKRKLMRMLDYKDLLGNKEGFVKIYPNNSLEHEQVKFLVCFKLKMLGFEVYTEIRINNHRADIIAFKEEKGYIIEVENSESQDSIDKKLNEFPLDFEVFNVKTKGFKLETFEI